VRGSKEGGSPNAFRREEDGQVWRYIGKEYQARGALGEIRKEQKWSTPNKSNSNYCEKKWGVKLREPLLCYEPKENGLHETWRWVDGLT